jgi:hypothetical protein
MAINERARVVDASDEDIGFVEAVLGEDDDDIFHGLAINLKGWAGHVELPADRIARITADKIYTDLGSGDGKTLDEFKPDRWFEFEGKKRFRKKAKWGKEDRGRL